MGLQLREHNIRNFLKVGNIKMTEGYDLVYSIDKLGAKEGRKRLFGPVLIIYRPVFREAEYRGRCVASRVGGHNYHSIFKIDRPALRIGYLALVKHLKIHSGKNDTEIARELGDEKLSKTVARARVRLKLFRELDFNMPFDQDELKILMSSEMTMKEISEKLGVSPTTLREYRHVIEQRDDTTLDPYLERIKDVMEDRDLTEKMAAGLQQDTLGEAIDVAESTDMSEIN